MSSGPPIRWRWVAAALLAGLATWLRFLPFEGMTKNGLWLSSMDDYGHLRRALRMVREFPALPYFDPLLNHPDGGLWIWPPLFDLLIALPSRLIFGQNAQVGEVTFVAALLPPLLGLLTLLAMFSLTRRILGSAEAWVTTAALAVLPLAVRTSSFGHADQHVGEVFFLVLVLATSARLIGVGGVLDAGLLSLALAGALLTWQGAVFLVPLVVFALWLAGTLESDRRWFLLGSGSLWVAAGIVSLFTLNQGLPLTYVSAGPFQPAFVGLFALLLGVCWIPRAGTPIAIVVGLAVAFLWPPIAGGVLNLFKASEGSESTSAYLSYPAEWLALIAEFKPLFSDPIVNVLRDHTVGLFLLPILVLLFLAWSRKSSSKNDPDRNGPEESQAGFALDTLEDGSKRIPLLLIVAMTVVVTLMALLQKRYGYYLAVPIALAWGVSLTQLWRKQRFVALAVAVTAILFSVPSWQAISRSGGAAGQDVFKTLDWLAREAPVPGDPRDLREVLPGEIPGVLGPWSLGHLVTARTGRPAVTDNFGYGFMEHCEAFSAPPSDDDEVARWLREANVGFLVTTEMRPLLPSYAAAVGRSEVAVESMLAARIHRSFERHPVPFLELIKLSETGIPGPDGVFLPRLKIYRVLEADFRAPSGGAGEP